MGKGKILIIDDEPDIIETVSYILQARNFSVFTAIDGFDGIEQAKVYKPDLILLDIMMPGIDGYETCLKLKSDKDTKNIPVIMFTAKGESESVLKAHKSGANDYIVKPFSLPTLLNKINKFFFK